jgi:hypothetical protein
LNWPRTEQFTIAPTADRCRCTESTIKDKLAIEKFHLPFSGRLYPEKRWVLFATLMPDEIALA